MEFDVTLTEEDMVRFNLYHTYSKFSSWFAMAVAVFAFFVAIWSYGRVSTTLTVIYFLVGGFVLIYIPGNTVLAARHRIRLMPEVLEPLHYKIDETGVTVSKNEDSASLTWDQVFKVVGVKTAVYIYSNRIHAYVIPKTALSGQEEALKNLALAHMEPRRVKL